MLVFGGAIKALNEDGLVGGWLVEFSDPEALTGSPDLEREFFTKSTDFDIESGDRTTIYYDHGLDATLKKRKLGRGQMEIKDAGIWLEAQLERRDEYEENIFKMAQAGKLGWSSGTAPHLVTMKKVGSFREILTWPLKIDASMTPTPCGYGKSKSVVALKTYMADREDGMTEDAFKSLTDIEKVGLYYELAGQVSLKAKWASAYVNELPDSSFAFIETGGTKDGEGRTTPRAKRHFPYKDHEGNADEAHVKSAIAQLSQSELPEVARAKALKTVQKAGKALGMEFVDPQRTAAEERVGAIKSLFGDALSKMTTPTAWQCFYALMDAVMQIRELDDAAAQTGVTVNIQSMLDESLNEFQPLLRQSIVDSLRSISSTDETKSVSDLAERLKGFVARLNPAVEKPAEPQVSTFKSLFDEVLAENKTQMWDLWDAVRQGCSKIAEAATKDITSVTGITVNIEEKVKELFGSFSEAAVPLAVQQIQAYVEDPDKSNNYYEGKFYLKSHVLDELLFAAKSDLESEFDSQSEAVESAVGLYADTSSDILGRLKSWGEVVRQRFDIRIKDGRTISAATKDRLTAIHDKLSPMSETMKTLMDAISELMKMAEPKVKAEVANQARAEFERINFERQQTTAATRRQ